MFRPEQSIAMPIMSQVCNAPFFIPLSRLIFQEVGNTCVHDEMLNLCCHENCVNVIDFKSLWLKALLTFMAELEKYMYTFLQSHGYSV